MQLIKKNSQCTDQQHGRAAVRCCVTDAERTCGASVCKSEYRPLTRINPANATYYEAQNECAAHGMRLCGVHELSACCGTGCGYDSARAWTSTTCIHTPHPLHHVEPFLEELLGPTLAMISSALSTALVAVASAVMGAVVSVGGGLLSVFTTLWSVLSWSSWMILGLLGLLVAAAVAVVLGARRFKDASAAVGAEDGGLRAYRKKEHAYEHRAYSRLDDEGGGGGAGGATGRASPLPVGRHISPVGTEKPIQGHMHIKASLPASARAGAFAKIPPSGVDKVRPGILADRRSDGTETGLYAGASS